MITDINMPEMDGIEVMVMLAGIHGGVPVVAISGGGLLSKELLLGNADQLGAVETVPKPFTPDQILGAVERALVGGESEND